MNFPLEWQPQVVSTQIARIGNIVIACVPGEFTTMSGRRLRAALRDALNLEEDSDVIIAGLCNTYSDYITTPEEYNVCSFHFREIAFYDSNFPHFYIEPSLGTMYLPYP